MKYKQIIIGTVLASVLIYSCVSNPKYNEGYSPTKAALKEPGDNSGVAVVKDNSKGEGKFATVELTHPLDQSMIYNGKTIYEVKCAACHKQTDEKLVGPGWKGVTDRRKPEWIMNFITNTDEMIDKDPEVQAMLDKCIVRMPNQHVNDKDARNILEFMRKNDGKN
jgi:mono/diheme cytochrome c family protein